MKNLKIRNKLLVLTTAVIITIAAIILVVSFLSINTQNDMSTLIYEEGFTCTSAILSADRDLYKIYLVIENSGEVWKHGGDISSSKNEYEDLLKNIRERIVSAKEILERDKARWSKFRDEKTDKDIFAYFESFLGNFDVLVELGKKSSMYVSADSNNKIPKGWQSSFNSCRADIVEIGAIVEAGTEEINSAALAKNRNMLLLIIIIGGAALIIIALVARATIASLAKPLNVMKDRIRKLATGDYTISIPKEYQNREDEVGDIARSTQVLIESFVEAMGSIAASTQQVSEGSRQVSEGSLILSQGATEQASSLEELTASIEQIASQTNLNAEKADKTRGISQAARDDAVSGNEQMKNMLAAMEEINESSENISKIIRVIDDIAFQTNILALNAAVEAARAGQHGRGFAVVAQEVRNLAGRSAKAAQETTDLIDGSVKAVGRGAKIARETDAKLSKIVEGITEAADLVDQIAIASNEQSAGIAQINKAIAQVSDVVQANSAHAEESATISEQLYGQASNLKDIVNRYIIKKESSKTPAGEKNQKKVKAEPNKEPDKPSNKEPKRVPDRGDNKESGLKLKEEPHYVPEEDSPKEEDKKENAFLKSVLSWASKIKKEDPKTNTNAKAKENNADDKENKKDKEDKGESKTPAPLKKTPPKAQGEDKVKNPESEAPEENRAEINLDDETFPVNPKYDKYK